MNYFDFLIIYLACGAPLGVFYFLQNRNRQIAVRLWLKTFLTFVFWLPFGARLMLNKSNETIATGKKVFFRAGKTDSDIFLFQKQFEGLLQKSNLPISIFEFREVFGRYVGLTIAADNENAKISGKEKEIFRNADRKNVQIGAICLKRRNLKQLAFHRIQARNDFFQILGQLAVVNSDGKNFIKSAANFFRLLNDCEAQSLLEKALPANLSGEKNLAGFYSEDYLWNTEICTKLPTKAIVPRLRNLIARAQSSVKD